MNKLLFNAIVLLIVSLGIFFAIYLRKETLTSPIKNKEKSILIGILGESRSDGQESLSYDEEVLTKLFNVFAKHDVHTIFFTGNLTFGWSKLLSGTIENAPTPSIIYSKDIIANDWNAKGYVFDPTIFRSQLKQFYSFVHSSFDYPIAFYPLMGNHDAIGSNSAKIFQEELHLTDLGPIPINQLRYSVTIGNAFFAIVPTNFYDNVQQQIVEHSLSSDTLTWLESVLKEAKTTHRYLFVLGHEPAYSTSSIFNKRSGIDNNPEQRDSFWNILKKYGVLVYFSSHEHVYDRSNRDGIWQVISGGGGSPLNEGGQNTHAFFHGLLLNIPQNDKDFPTIKVLDTEGNVRDYFELQQEKQALHQFRISMAYD